LDGKLTHGAIITFSISTSDENLAKMLELGAPTPQERLETMKKGMGYLQWLKKEARRKGVDLRYIADRIGTARSADEGGLRCIICGMPTSTPTW